MSLSAIPPRGSIRIPVHGHLAARSWTCVDRRDNFRSFLFRITPSRCVSAPVSITAGVSVPVLSAVGFGSVGASSRAVRMSRLSVVMPRSDFAML